MMQLGAKGLALIKNFEQCRLSAYQDQKGVWTIGWGHTGPEVHQGLVWTQAQADAQLVIDTREATLGVIRSLDVAISQDSFDALVSFTFNVGVSAEAHSTLVKLINAKKTGAAVAEFVKWDHIDGVPDPGLLRRREAERDLFSEGLV